MKVSSTSHRSLDWSRILRTLLPLCLVLIGGLLARGVWAIGAVSTLLGGGIAIAISRSHRRRVGATKPVTKGETITSTMGGAGLATIILGGAAAGPEAAGGAFVASLILSPISALGWWALIKADLPDNAEAYPAEAATIGGSSESGSANAARIERDCPWCAERVLAKARVCKHCGRELEPLDSAR